MKLCISAFMATLCIGAASASSPDISGVAYKNPGLPVETRVQDLLGRMTLDEKIGQLNQRSYWESPQSLEIFSGYIAEGSIGSLLNTTDAETVDKLQRVAMQQSRLGIPVLMSRDVIHGYKTIFPIPLGQAATFDDEIVELGAHIAAVEASSDGIRWTFAPMMDISRDARWGRIAESFGEDTYLSSRMAAAMVRGFQGNDLTAPTSIAACAKHFVGYGASESGRDYNSTYITERQLRNDYLPPFKAACEAGCLTYMSSFNDNDGIPASGNSHTLKDILRGEWGFKGFVVSDWGSVAEMINHGFCSDRKDAAMKGFNAGVDMEMESATYIENLKQLISEGKVDMADIDTSVANILRVKFMLGLFENPYVVTGQDVKYSPEHLTAAYRTALESAVLLKNENDALPLTNKKRILITGPLADAAHDQMGTWVFDGEKEHTVTLLKAIRDRYGKQADITYEPGLAYSRDMSTDGIAKAVAAAEGADVIIAVVGEESILSGEAHSLADIGLVGQQSALIDALAGTGKPLVTIIMAGRPMVITRQLGQSTAMIYSFHPGTMGGPALADLIFGKESPSGKLPATFPRMSGQTPIYYNRHNTGRPNQGNEKLLYEVEREAGQTSTGCTSFFMDAGYGPLLPFGYGLSYGKFDYSGLKLDKSAYSADDTIHATITLTNSGKHEATEVAQLYVRDLVGSVTRPVKELKDYKRVTLAPGQSVTVSFDLPVSRLSFYGLDMTEKVEPGEFILWIGGDSDCTASATFKVNS